MASDEPAKPGPVVLRIKLRYEDVDTMVHRFAPNVGKSGLFLPTRSLQPLGAEIKFELRLANDTPVLVGHGRVKHVREPDPKNPKASFGMAVELLRVTRESREVILRMLERRRTLGLAEVGIPMPEDLEIAAAPKAGSGPVLTAPRRSSGPIAIAKLAEVASLAPEAPRKKRPVIGELIASASGPVAMVAIPELDEHVDVGAAMARARVLAAGADVDAELEALRDQAAAPIEITIDAASAELARQLGGIAVRRDRSGGWATPPPVVEAKPEPVVEAKPEPVVEAKPEPVVEAKPEPVVEAKPEPVVEAAPTVARTRTPVFEGEQLDQLLAEEEAPKDAELLEARSRERRLGMGMRARTRSRNLPPIVAPEPEVDEIAVSEAEVVGETVLANMPSEVLAAQTTDDPDVLQQRLFTPAGVDEIATDPHAEVAAHGPMIDDNADPESFVPEPHHSGEHELLDEADLEEVEHTQMGEVPVDPNAFAAHAYATEPAAHEPAAHEPAAHEPAAHEDEALAESLDAQLAAAENEDNGLSELDAEELDDVDILAEADADDADLLLADGEGDVGADELPPHHEAPEHLAPEHLGPDDLAPEHLDEPMARPSMNDFVARLDFDGEATPVPHDPLSAFERDSMADLGAAAYREADDDYGQGYARRSDPSAFRLPSEPLPAYELVDDDPPGRHDIPAIEEDDFHERRAANPKRISVHTNVLNPEETFTEAADEPQYLAQPPQDLDEALEALDVDQDDLSIPHARRPSTGPSRVAHKAGTPAPKPARAPSEDGILIDFDDDD